MYKIKTNAKLRKCVKITGTGKIMRKKTGKNHMLDKKTTKRKRALSKKCAFFKGDIRKIRKSLNI